MLISRILIWMIWTNKGLFMKDFDVWVNLMDDELREQVHAELAPCTDEAFLERYKQLHFEKYGEEFTID